jgi:hypothetical protein
MDATPKKRCTWCGLEQPITQFQADKRYRGGRRYQCSACHALARARPVDASPTKRCTRCGLEKPVTHFQPNRRYRGGRHHQCQACRAAQNKARRHRHREQVRAWDRDYARACYYKPEGRRKILARHAANWAVLLGLIDRRHECEHCGMSDREVGLQKHHPDYRKPIDVVWLCPACHGKEHHRLRARRAAKP